MKQNEKKKWEKPQCLKVKLIVEEAVLTACKMPGGGGGPATKNCKTPGNTPCIQQGS